VHFGGAYLNPYPNRITKVPLYLPTYSAGADMARRANGGISYEAGKGYRLTVGKTASARRGRALQDVVARTRLPVREICGARDLRDGWDYL
jgi:hypothetical protein